MHALIPDSMLSELNQLQQKILAKGIPVLILFEGSSGRVIGRVNTELIRCLEPRGVVYSHFDTADPESPESMMDFLWRTPGKGQIGLSDRSWYSMMIEKYSGAGMESEMDKAIARSNDFERYLVLNGVLLIKIILKAPEAAIKKYGPQYGPSTPRVSFLSMDHIDPAKYRDVMINTVSNRSNTEYAPWDKIDVRDIGETFLEVVETIMRKIKNRLETDYQAPFPPEITCPYPNPRGESARDPDCEPYEEKMDELSARLCELQMDLSLSDRSMIICFEGWDASGKGSCIKHLCHAFSPRGYAVVQTKAPTPDELSHTYLWRFCKALPRKGHATIFDRTWYGRMMVEHIEGFCTEGEYRRSPFEINAFEKMLVNSGIILVKFWMDISPEEQLKRFNKRTKDPLKKWKITDEDWRNRAKWNEYVAHVDTMIGCTNTVYAPWTVVPADNKKYARVKVLKTVVEVMEKELKG
jgi:polyphosphate kinase 2 (PPK2 family)